MRLRPATLADSTFLYGVRNDPDVRRWSRNQDAFSELQHEAWLAEALRDKKIRLYIAVDDGIDIGYTKLVMNSFTVSVEEVSLALAVEHRGHGSGSVVLRCAVDDAVQRAVTLTARVYNRNVGSLVAFLRNGFVPFSFQGCLGADAQFLVGLIRKSTTADAERICDGCRAGWPHRRHPLDRISSRWASEAERDADMATWPVRYDLHEESVGDGQVLVHECTAARLFDRSLA